MELYIPEQEFDPNAHAEYFSRSKVGTLDVLGATAEDTLYYNPMTALNAFLEQRTGKGLTGELLTADEYRESEFYREGMEVPENGITTGLAQLLAERKDRRDSINLQLSRSRGGMGLMAAQFGVGLAVSMLDPINVVSSFVPSFAAARLGIAMKSYGTAGGRFMSGARDGLLTSIPIEGIVLGQAALEGDDDYTAMDTFMNLTFGTVIGGGLHAGFGAISDSIQKSRARKETLANAVNQTTSGQEVNVEALQNAAKLEQEQDIIDRANQRMQNQTGAVERTIDPETGQVKTTEILPQDAREFDLETGQPLQPATFKTKGKNLPPMLRPKPIKSLLQFIRSRGMKINPDSVGADDLKDQIPVRGSNLFSKKGMTVDEAFAAAREEGYFPDVVDGQVDELDMRMLVDALIDEYQSGVPTYRSADQDVVLQMEEAEVLLRMAQEYGVDPKGLSDEDFIAAINDARGREVEARRNRNLLEQNLNDPYADYDIVDKTPVEQGAPMTLEESENMMQQGRITDHLVGEDKDQLPKVKEQDERGFDLDDQDDIKLRQEVEMLEQDVQTLAAAGALRQDNLDEIQFADELIAKAEEGYDEVTRAGAVCMNRNFRA